MLAEYTLKFTHLFRIYPGVHQTKEYQNYKKKINKVIEELDRRGLVPRKNEATLPNEDRPVHINPPV